MKNCCSWGKTFATGWSYVITSVVGSGASKLVECAINGAIIAAGPSPYLMMRLPVKAASAAVIGLPSDHEPLDLTLKVQTLPSLEVVHESAQSPVIL